MKVIAARNFILNGTPYTANSEFEIKDKKLLMELNSKSFIRPLTEKQLENLKEKETFGGSKKFIRDEEEIENDRRYRKN